MWPIMLQLSIARIDGLIIKIPLHDSGFGSTVQPDSARQLEASRTSLGLDQKSSSNTPIEDHCTILFGANVR